MLDAALDAFALEKNKEAKNKGNEVFGKVV